VVNTYSKNTDIHIGEIMLKKVTSSFKSGWFWFLEVAEATGRARAAAELSRRGLHDKARDLLLK
jgi:hypothetical protein